MRVFESCAAKCLVITDPLPSLKALFGSSLEYVDASADPKETAAAIADIMRMASTNPQATAERIEAAHEIFRSKVSLEALLSNVVDDVVQRQQEMQKVAITEPAAPTVSVIIRCGNRPLSMLKRAIASLQRQYYQNIAIIFARFSEIPGFISFVDELRESGRFQDIQVVEVRGEHARSTCLWAGLRHVQTPFFANLDDDDEWFPDHLFHTMATFDQEPLTDLVYAGGVAHNEDGPLSNLHPRLQRADGTFVPENRELLFLDAFDLDRLLRWDNMILSHSFVARSCLLNGPVLDDPKLAAVEDVYLYLLLITRGAQFRFNGRVTVVWNWRDASQDSSVYTIAHHQKSICLERIVRRLSDYRFPGGLLGRDVIGRGYKSISAPSKAVYNESSDTSCTVGRQCTIPHGSIVSAVSPAGDLFVQFLALHSVAACTRTYPRASTRHRALTRTLG